MTLSNKEFLLDKHKEFLLNTLHGWMHDCREHCENEAKYTTALEVAYICWNFDVITEATFHRCKRLLFAYRWPRSTVFLEKPVLRLFNEPDAKLS